MLKIQLKSKNKFMFIIFTVQFQLRDYFNNFKIKEHKTNSESVSVQMFISAIDIKSFYQ